MMHYNCLIVDDETELAAMTAEYFQMFDVSCACVESAAACVAFLQENTAELLLLDINLKEESGFSLCKKVREESSIPILFISARQSDDDVLIALNIGGDDYVRKPYSLSVLLAKVKIMLRRMGNNGDEKNDAEEQDGNIRLREETMRIHIGEKEIQLKAREFKLFKCLFDNRNTIVTKERLFNTVWENSFYSDSTLNVHIRRLREKIEEDPNDPKLIKTIWGTGYMLEMCEKCEKKFYR